jgi:hypothetical protein
MQHFKKGKFFEGREDNPTTQEQQREAEEQGLRLEKKEPIPGRTDDYYYSYVAPKN